MSTATRRGEGSKTAAELADELRWLDLHARQLRDRIGSLKAERRARGGLRPRTLKLLLDSIDELARTEGLRAEALGLPAPAPRHACDHADPCKCSRGTVYGMYAIGTWCQCPCHDAAAD